jgi:hypothetical protein
MHFFHVVSLSAKKELDFGLFFFKKEGRYYQQMLFILRPVPSQVVKNVK